MELELSTHTLARQAAHFRGKIAALSRSRGPDDPDLLAARHGLRVAKLAEHVARVLAEQPPLTPEEIERVASVLRGGEAA